MHTENYLTRKAHKMIIELYFRETAYINIYIIYT